MRRVACVCRKLWSPPSRRRGLKFPCKVEDLPDEKVASFSEAWIEMRRVACVCRKLWSPPSRRRGLKFPCKVEDLPDEKVASFSEAWIEIQSRS